MSVIKDDNYIGIQGWMINRLQLKGNELIVYALIFGFTQDGSTFAANREYIASAIGSKRLATATDVINKLIDKGLVEQVEQGKFRAVNSTESVPSNSTESVPSTVRKAYPNSTENVLQQYGKRTETVRKAYPYNNNKYIYNYIYKYSVEDTEENHKIFSLIDEWFCYRKSKKSPINNDVSAERLIKKFISYYEQYGHDAVKGILDISITNNYTALVLDRLDKQQVSKPEPKKEKDNSSYDSNAFTSFGLNLNTFDVLSDD